MTAAEEVYTERVYIDPERLLKLKKERKSLKLVPSVFEPPADEAPWDPTTARDSSVHSLKARSRLSRDNNLSAQLLVKSRSPNVQFIVGLLGEVRGQQVSELQQGDCLNVRLDERWLLLQGEVRVVGLNGHGYAMQEGYFFFVSDQSKKKIKEVVCLRRSRVLRISTHTYESFLRNYLFLKNAEKIKYLKYCPFFLWSDHLSEDLAACMSFATFDREDTLYLPGAPADSIYFVKEGVVLLERNASPGNPTLREYEAHYEKEETSEEEATLIVKKGMVFGIDGILIKESPTHIPTPTNSPQAPSSPPRKRLNCRIYSARTIGRTQLYCIRRQVLQTLFSQSDLQSPHNFPKEMTKADLQRICSDYADLVVRHRSLPRITQAVVRKELVLDRRQPSASHTEKRVNAQRIRLHEEAVKKLSIANMIPGKQQQLRREEKEPELNASLLNQLNYKLSLSEGIPDSHPFAFPSLTNAKRRKQPQEENLEKYIFKWLKDSDPQRDHLVAAAKLSGGGGKERSREKERLREGQKEMVINVRSYRSIIPLLL